MKTYALLLVPLLLAGCATPSDRVISGTSTVLGLEIAENPTTQLYHARFGYVRAELAAVPTNKGTNGTAVAGSGGAKDTANVIMELRYAGILSRSGGIYQRLAVGDKAVTQPGAAFMFAKSGDGTLDAATASAVATAVHAVPAVPAVDVSSAMLPLAKAYASALKPEVFDAVARKSGFTSFSAFLVSSAVTVEQVKTIAADLKNLDMLP